MGLSAHPGAFHPGQVYPGQMPPAGPLSRRGPEHVASYRFDLLTRDETVVGRVRSVQQDGDLSWHSTESIKSSGTITVLDTGQRVDWLNSRVRPVRVHEYADGSADEWPLGVYIASAPVESWSDVGRTWTVELLDKNSILDSDIYTDEDGVPHSFSVVAGESVIGVVRSLIESTGESAPMLDDAVDVSVTGSMTWEVGTTLLQIINDLLAAANFFSLWTDGLGRFRVTPYVDPVDRPVIYADGTEYGVLTPFSYGESSLMGADWTRDLDIYAIPNRWVCISEGSSDEEALVATATNEDPASPFSYPSRGRWVTRVQTSVDAVDQDALEAAARRSLEAATNVTAGLSVEHLFLPELRINSVVHFVNDPADGLDVRTTVLNTTVSFDPLALCSTELREFAGSDRSWRAE